jgi:hypothetical protein
VARGAVVPLVPGDAGALVTPPCATGGAAVVEVGETIVVIVPFTLSFCFLDDVGIGPRRDRASRYRLRSG